MSSFKRSRSANPEKEDIEPEQERVTGNDEDGNPIYVVIKPGHKARPPSYGNPSTLVGYSMDDPVATEPKQEVVDPVKSKRPAKMDEIDKYKGPARMDKGPIANLKMEREKKKKKGVTSSPGRQAIAKTNPVRKGIEIFEQGPSSEPIGTSSTPSIAKANSVCCVRELFEGSSSIPINTDSTSTPSARALAGTANVKEKSEKIEVYPGSEDDDSYETDESDLPSL